MNCKLLFLLAIILVSYEVAQSLSVNDKFHPSEDPDVLEKQRLIIDWLGDNIVLPIYDFSREKLNCLAQCMQGNVDEKSQKIVLDNFQLFYECLKIC